MVSHCVFLTSPSWHENVGFCFGRTALMSAGPPFNLMTWRENKPEWGALPAHLSSRPAHSGRASLAAFHTAATFRPAFEHGLHGHGLQGEALNLARAPTQPFHRPENKLWGI